MNLCSSRDPLVIGPIWISKLLVLFWWSVQGNFIVPPVSGSKGVELNPPDQVRMRNSCNLFLQVKDSQTSVSTFSTHFFTKCQNETGDQQRFFRFKTKKSFSFWYLAKTKIFLSKSKHPGKKPHCSDLSRFSVWFDFQINI